MHTDNWDAVDTVISIGTGVLGGTITMLTWVHTKFASLDEGMRKFHDTMDQKLDLMRERLSLLESSERLNQMRLMEIDKKLDRLLDANKRKDAP